MDDLTDLAAALRLTQELLDDLAASGLADKVFLTRPAYYVRVEDDKREPAEPSPQFAAQCKLKLSRGEEHLRDHFIRTNQERKLKLFSIFTLGSFPMGDYNTSVSTFRAGLERAGALLQREMTEAITSACGASGSQSVEHASRAEALDRPAGPDVRADRQPARTLPSPSPPAMSKEEWVRDGWPGKLKQARGSRTQKEAALECGVSVETYKKWEQGAHPPNAANFLAVLRFVGLNQ